MQGIPLHQTEISLKGAVSNHKEIFDASPVAMPPRGGKIAVRGVYHQEPARSSLACFAAGLTQ
jgi:hypothetical protein